MLVNQMVWTIIMLFVLGAWSFFLSRDSNQLLIQASKNLSPNVSVGFANIQVLKSWAKFDNFGDRSPMRSCQLIEHKYDTVSGDLECRIVDKRLWH